MDEKKLREPHTFESPLCAEIGAEFFYDEDDNTIDKESVITSQRIAKSICAKCQHAADCAEWGLYRERWGIWGGLTPKERIVIRQNRRITLKEIPSPFKK